MHVSKRIGLTLGALLLAALLAAPAWSQSADPPEPAGPQFLGELVQLALRYAEQQDWDIGPEEKAEVQSRLAAGVAEMAGKMRRLGYDDQQITRAIMQAVREALQTRLANRSGAEEGTGAGDLLQIRLEQHLRLAECEGAQAQIQDRAGDQLRAGKPNLVAGAPGGAGGPGGGGKP